MILFRTWGRRGEHMEEEKKEYYIQNWEIRIKSGGKNVYDVGDKILIRTEHKKPFRRRRKKMFLMLPIVAEYFAT